MTTNTIPTLEQVHDLYRVCITADREYEQTIKAFCGPKATRWTINEEARAHPAIKAALIAKLDSFNAWEAASRARDERGEW